MKKLTVTLLAAISLLLPAAEKKAVGITDKGYSASAFFTAENADGILLKKNGVLVLTKKGRVLVLSILDKNGKNAATLTAGLTPGKQQAVAVQLERILEKAQGIDGYRAMIFINGKRSAELDISPLAVKTDPSVIAAGKKVTSVTELPRTMSAHELRTNSKQLVSRRWRPRKKDAVLLETDSLIVNVCTRSAKGNPLLGVFNKNTQTLMIPYGGLSWELCCRDTNGAVSYYSPADFTFDAPEIKQGNGSYRIRNVWKNDKFHVVSNWFISGGRIETDLAVKQIAGPGLETVVFPSFQTLKMPGKEFAVIPRFSGIVHSEPSNHLRYRSTWPSGNASMQFWAVYNDSNDGIYFAREDASGAIKEQLSQGSGGVLDSSWITAVPRGQTEFSMPGKGVIEVYKGDWFEAGQIYKKFVRTTPWWIEEIPRKDSPEWFMKNPLWLLGFDINSSVTAESLIYLRDFFGVKYGLETGLLYNMHKKWRFGPDFQFKDTFLTYRDALQEADIMIGPYYNPRLCYAGKTADAENNYSNTGKHYAVRTVTGKIATENYGEPYAIMCPGSQLWQKQLFENISRIADGKVGFIYHDQLPCAKPFACNVDNHGHDINDPYAWLVKGHWLTYAKVKGELREKYPNLAHTGEDASEAFLHCIDGFMTWRFGMPGHVPLFQSIFAPRIQFVGRGSDGSISGTYESFFPKYGEQLVFNEQIGWPNLDDIRYPSPRRNYLKKLAQLRNAAVDFFLSAEMLKPLSFRKPPETMSCRWGVQSLGNVTSDKILHAVWQNTDGRIMMIFLNTVDQKQSVEPVIGFEFDNMTALRERGKTVSRYGKNIPAKVELEPFGVEFWFFNTAPDDPDTAKIAKILPLTAKIMKSDRGVLLQYLPADLEKRSYRNAVTQTLYAKDADWLLFSSRYRGGGLEYDPKSIYKPYTYNWISAQDGAVISYGATFIDRNSAGIELEITTDQPGVKVQFFDISNPSTDKIMAETVLTPGHWYNRKKIRLNWRKKPHTDTPWMIIKVTGGQCNIGSWQVVMPKGKAPANNALHEPPAMPDYRLESRFYMQGAGKAPLAPKAARWMLFSRMENNLIAARDGALICYGGTSLGPNADCVEIEVANADPGVKIEFLNIWKEALYQPIAVVTPTAGAGMQKYRAKWLHYKKMNRPHLVIRVTGGKCTIGSWRSIQQGN